jgi:anti-sigma factor RsiW
MDVDNCRQLIEELLSSYVDGELDNATAQSLELHLQMCPPCAAFLRTFMATKKCVRGEAVAVMPADCEASLWGFLERELEVEPPPEAIALRASLKGAMGGCGSSACGGGAKPEAKAAKASSDAAHEAAKEPKG